MATYSRWIDKGNTQVSVLAQGDQNSWSAKQIKAWEDIVNAGDAFVAAFREKKVLS